MIYFFEQFLQDLNHAFQQTHFTLIRNPNPTNDVILGGCCLGMLGKFKDIVADYNEYNNPTILYSQKNQSTVQQLDFYNVVICTPYYWFREMNAL